MGYERTRSNPKYADLSAQYGDDAAFIKAVRGRVDPNGDPAVFARAVARNEHGAAGQAQAQPQGGATPPPAHAAAPNLSTPGMPLVGIGANVAKTVAENGGLSFANPLNVIQRGLTGEALKAAVGAYGVATHDPMATAGAAKTLAGLGPLMGGILHAGTLPFRLAARDPNAGVEAAQAARAFVPAAKRVGGEILRHTGEEIQNPGGEFLKDPLATGLDALALADLPAIGLRAGASAASRLGGRAGLRVGGKGLAKGAREAAMAMGQAAEKASLGATASRGLAAAEKAHPPLGEFMQDQRNIRLARGAMAAPTKVAAARAEVEGKDISKGIKGLRPSEREAITPMAMGLASMAPNPMRPPTIIEKLLRKGPQPANAEGMQNALDWWKNKSQGYANEDIAAGLLDPRTAEIRKGQPLRLATGGENQMKFEGAPRRVNDVTGLEKRAKQAEKLAKGARKKGILAAVKESEAARLGGALKQSNVETQALIAAEKKAAGFAGRSAQGQKGLSALEPLDARIESARAELGALRGAPQEIASASRQAGRFEGASALAQKKLQELDHIDAQLSEWRKRMVNEALPENLPWQHSQASVTEPGVPTLRDMVSGKDMNPGGPRITDPRRVAAERVGVLEQLRKQVVESMRDVSRAEVGLARVADKAKGARGSGNRIYKLAKQLGEDEATRARMVGQATDVTKAELGLEAQKNAALASKAAIPGRPATLARKLGKTEAQLSEAQRWQRVAKAGEDRSARLLAKADAKRGKIPALDRLERQTEAAKFLDPTADPSYVPMLAKRGERLKEMYLKVTGRNKPTGVPTPGYAKQSSGARFVEGNYEKDLGKIAARHAEARIAFKQRVEQLQNIVSQPFARAIKHMDEVDWTKEALVAPEAFIKNTGDGMNHADQMIRDAMASTNPGAHLADAARESMTKVRPNAAPEGQLFAVPKSVAREMEGQLKAEGRKNPWLQAFFDYPNDYLRLSALTLRPGFYVNNLLGNAGLATLSGANPKNMLKAALERDAMPEALRGTGYAAVETPRTSITLSHLAKGPKFFHAMNEGIDNIFRHAAFKSEVEKQAMRKSIRETGTRLAKNMSDAEKIALLGPEGEKAALQHVNQFLNDYTVQSPFQRRVLRRVMPFQSFLVHMSKLAFKLPFTDPNRARILAQMATLGNEYQDEQFKQVGMDPENVAPYRKNQLPVRKTDTGAITFGTGGANPASGLNMGEFDANGPPGAHALTNFAVDQSGIGPKFLANAFRGTNGIGIPYSKPGITHKFGSNDFYDASGKQVDAPSPSLVDLIRMNNPYAGVAERLYQPNETYDLTGSDFPWSDKYLPNRPIKGKVVPRKYNAQEAIMALLGIPIRDFTRDELANKGKQK